jgi:hypothetical protein
MAALAASNSLATSQPPVTSLTDDFLEFSHDDARPVGFAGDFKRGWACEISAAPVHQTFRLITQRRPQSSLDAPHAIIGLGHGVTPDTFSIGNSVSDGVV